MFSGSAVATGALTLVLSLASPALAQESPLGPAPAGRTAADPPSTGGPATEDRAPQPGFVPAVEQQSGDEPRPRAREAARTEGGDRDRDDDLDRARAAARAADPRMIGLERARAAARNASPDGRDCLSAREARTAIMSKRAVNLSRALKTARDAWDGEVIDYKLCTFDGVLAYDLTLLSTEGRVARVRVGAADGKLVGVR